MTGAGRRTNTDMRDSLDSFNPSGGYSIILSGMHDCTDHGKGEIIGWPRISNRALIDGAGRLIDPQRASRPPPTALK